MLGAIDGRLFNIKGGNRQLAERLIKAADASLHIGTRVTGIHRRKHGTFELHTKHTSASLKVRWPIVASLGWACSDVWSQHVIAMLSKPQAPCDGCLVILHGAPSIKPCGNGFRCLGH